MSGASTILDILVAGLLLATIAFAWRLERRIALLRSEKAQFAQLMADFTQATARAEAGVRALEAAAADAGRGLEGLVARAHGLREDLVYMIERAEPIADRLSPVARAEAPVAPAARPAARPEAATARPARAAASTDDLLKSLAGLR
ncbi:MAG: hypothetical protein RLZZ276_4048 [Pseudomonadota bacterium]|jgi:hypothetical protein